MAILLKENFSFVFGPYTYNIKLTGPIVVIRGNSGVGKSLMAEHFRLASKDSLLWKDNPPVIVQNYKSDTKSLSILLRNSKNNLFIIDNADILIDSYELLDLLQTTKNQINLFGRNVSFFNVPLGCTGYLINSNKAISIDYSL